MLTNHQLFSALKKEDYPLYPPLYPIKGNPKLNPTPQRPKKHLFFWLLSIIIVIFVVLPMRYQSWTFDEAVVQKPDGTYELSAARQAKHDNEVERLRNAEQYALVARINAWYPCYNCLDIDSIYLHSGEVWKYGITTLGLQGRYRGGLPNRHLQYIPQFKGTVALCLEEEKRKIYSYPILPENLNRTNRLVRPPGNKRDN